MGYERKLGRRVAAQQLAEAQKSNLWSLIQSFMQLRALHFSPLSLCGWDGSHLAFCRLWGGADAAYYKACVGAERGVDY